MSKIYVKDFGAKADGITDDGVAIANACLELKKSPDGSELIFENDKTYFVSDLPENIKSAIYLHDLKGVSVTGNNTTILLGRDKGYMEMVGCSDITVKGFNFDLKERAHFVGTVETVDFEVGYFDVISDRDFGFDGEYIPEYLMFALTAVEGTSREYLRINKYATLNKEALKYRIYVRPDDGFLATDVHFKELSVGRKVIIPVPGIGHKESHMFKIYRNENINFYDINVWNVPYFVWIMRNNTGKVVFDNVNVMPPEDEEVCFSSWRDCFHCKSNLSQFIWKNCTFKGNGDDIFNLSANMMYVNSVISENEITCYWPETRGAAYENPDIGEPVVIWDKNDGELIGYSRLKEIADRKSNRFILSDNLPKLRAGENVLFAFDSHAGANSQVINCDLDGTFRFRSGPVTVSDCKIHAVKVWIEPEPPYEGALPHDISFNNCEFDVFLSFVITSRNPNSKWKEGQYRLENISFNNCTGLKKEHFSESNFDEKSTDYIKFSPALTE